MKITVAIILFVTALKAERIGFVVKSICPTRQICLKRNVICPNMHLIDRNLEGCCCKPVCAGRNEVYTCGCADKVCNQHQIFCIRCQDGCFCKEGYVRDYENGNCILEKQCPLIA